jgi:hypothetical protein
VSFFEFSSAGHRLENCEVGNLVNLCWYYCFNGVSKKRIGLGCGVIQIIKNCVIVAKLEWWKLAKLSKISVNVFGGIERGNGVDICL